jgi:RND family efflux transporter MFP subunit
VTLTRRAVERLGIELAEVELRRVERTRTLGGELVPLPGRAVMVSAPQAGTLIPAPSGALPVSGATVKAGDPLFRLLLLPPGDLSRAQEEVALGEVRLHNASSKARRAAQLLQDRAISVRELEAAQEELASAEKALDAARGRVDLLSGKALRGGGLKGITPLTLRAPNDGVIQRVMVGPGQLVSAATPLVEVVSVDPLWVRVPVYVGDLAAIEPGALAAVRGLQDAPSAPPRSAKPVPAPPSADPGTASADLFFELQNRDGVYRPGHRVSVTLALRESEESLVVPWSAVIHDVNGGAWVYESRPPTVFLRRRVEVRHVIGDLAVLANGPPAGTSVVRTGAFELFGTEFGTGK